MTSPGPPVQPATTRRHRDLTFRWEPGRVSMSAPGQNRNAAGSYDEVIVDFEDASDDDQLAIHDTFVQIAISAATTTGGDEKYVFAMEYSDSSDFSTAVFEGARFEAGDASQVGGNFDVGPGVYELKMRNDLSGTPLRYGRVRVDVFGAAPSVTYTLQGELQLEEGFEVQYSTNAFAGGQDYHHGYFPRGTNECFLLNYDEAFAYTFRVRSWNNTGVSSWTTDAAFQDTPNISGPIAGSETSVYLLIGDHVDGIAGQKPLGAHFDGYNLSGIASSFEEQFRFRNFYGTDANGEPIEVGSLEPALIWNHIGNTERVSSITANGPDSDVVMVTEFPREWGLQTNDEIRVRFEKTGTALDGADRTASVTGSNTLTVLGIADTGSGGVMSLPGCQVLNDGRRATLATGTEEDINSANNQTDYRRGGRYPSLRYSYELAVAVGAHELAKPSESVPVIVQIGGAQALRSVATDALTAGRWMSEFASVGSDSGWARIQQTIKDVKLWLDRSKKCGSGSGRDVKLRGVVVGLGHTELDQAQFQYLPRRLIVSAAVMNGGTLELTLRTDKGPGHGLGTGDPPAGKAKFWSKFAGFDEQAGTTAEINGKTERITVLDFERIAIDKDFTGLSAPGATNAFAIPGDPVGFISEDTETFLNELRAELVSVFDTGQDASDVPAILLPCTPSPERQFYNRSDFSTPGRQVDDPFAALSAYMRSLQSNAAGILDNTASIDLSEIDYNTDVNTGLLLPHKKELSGYGSRELGQRAWRALRNPNVIGNTKTMTPVPVCFSTGHSWAAGIPISAAAWISDASKRWPLIPPSDWMVFNHGDKAFEPFQWEAGDAYGTLLGSANANTHPIWNTAIAHVVGPLPSLMASMAERWPGQPVYWLPLARHKSTVGIHTYTSSPLYKFPILAITIDAPNDKVTISFGDSQGNTGQDGTLDFANGRDIEVLIEGTSGTTPSLNGPHLATPINAVNGTSSDVEITVPGIQAGTIAPSGDIYAHEGIWHPDYTGTYALYPDLLVAWEQAYAALYDDGKLAVPQVMFMQHGHNDASNDLASEFQASLQAFVDAVRRDLGGRPGSTHDNSLEQLPIVLMKTIIHPDNVASQENFATVRLAQEAVASPDPYMALAVVDWHPDTEQEGAPIAFDNVHATLEGNMRIGRKMAGSALDLISGSGLPTRDIPDNPYGV